jgi:D-alanine transaminase
MYDTSLEVETFGYVVNHAFESKDLKVSLCEDIRWQRCDIKSTSLLGNVMSMNQSKNNHCDEVIMHKDDEITEGGASNVFFVIDGNIHTPSLSTKILPGITRELLISETKQNGIFIEEGNYSVNDLLRAESIWLTSSTKGLGQVIEIIGHDTKIQVNNEVFHKCNEIFNNAFLSG